MIKKVSSLEKKYKGLAKESTVEAELLIKFFNFWPEVQVKWLLELGFNKSDIKTIMKLSDKYAELKVKLINERIPKNRKDIIIIENDVLEMIYKPRLMILKEPTKGEAIEVASKWIKQRYKDAVILDPKKLDDLEALMRHPTGGVDFLVFTKDEVIGYEVELKHS